MFFPTNPTKIAARHYLWLLRKYGPNHQAVQWSSLTAQTRRFSVLAHYLSQDTSVVDLGCGLGDFYRYLTSEQQFTGQYLGLDCVAEFVEHAAKTWPVTTFRQFDATNDTFPTGSQWWLVSGMFNNLFLSQDKHLKWMHGVLNRAFQACETAIGFNCLSTRRADIQPGLFYRDPEDAIRWCREHLSTNLVLRHDYNPPPESGVAPDFTVIVYK